MTAAVYRSPRGPLVSSGRMDVHTRDMTAVFAGDVTLAAAQAKLAEAGQWLAMDGDAAATLGELVLSNSTGPLRLGYGGWRDQLLGVQFTNGRGELISAGGRTMKNVAGYDLTKFIVGSAGVFGKIVAITVRTYRRPVAALVARYAPDVAIVGRLMPTSLRPQWAIFTGDALLCGYVGDAAMIEYYRGALPRTEPMEVTQRSVEEDIAWRAEVWRVRGAVACRASVPPTRIGEFIAKAGMKAGGVNGASSEAGATWIADAAFGIVLGSNLHDESIATLRDAATAVGGSVRFVRPGGGENATAIDFSTNPVERQIIDRLKRAFDPDGTLNPLPWQSH